MKEKQKIDKININICQKIILLFDNSQISSKEKVKNMLFFLYYKIIRG